MNIDPFTIETIRNMPEPKNTMGDDETLMQLTKIALGVVTLIIIGSLLYHINFMLGEQNKQAGRTNELLTQLLQEVKRD